MSTDLTLEVCWQQLTEKLDLAGLSYGHGAIDAQSEALWIISTALGFPPEDAAEALDTPITLDVLAQIDAWALERIRTRKPLAYILGEAWLMGIPFYCDERSIVPRSFIAELIVDGHLEPWLPPSAKVLDLCTGNGSLAILMALSCPDVEVSGSDISMQALSLAAKNIDRHNLSEQIEIHQGDLFESLPSPNEENLFDLIICNPPYVNATSMANLPAEYHAEPEISLAGGADGMDIVRKIIANAKDYLKPEGALVLEIGNEAKNFSDAFPEIPVTWLEVSAGDDQVLLIQAEDL
ncbi:50S ribosomal protein L3 N(5)-glutamine methyltransferase [Polynucleobacter sp. AM-26B4]|uniref:50S ribosomal protein L3 N(5)-glutamine methyltransferase n=1 Tax=Polynucleobacter sp. AM-26B4 TaxID=2689103 RepID=UPI001C0E1E91|nr:50S ribosomal protein L3 N(5)-glutamine methyltransferase [Polynucleobacter sp. AM-26B4]MBU3584632.1 50S ribosomal protein L3 N(5)-glutamine methyltransferase [Polynucleobacter sp. AM-26B4]